MHNIIVGGGITGIFCAYFLKKKYPEKETVIIERSSSLGGLLKSVDYGEFGKFDYGVHTFYETGVKTIDDFFLKNQPNNGWQFQEGYERDLGGCIFDGNTNFKSPYPDFRSLPVNKLNRYRSEIIENLKGGYLDKPDYTVSALDFLEGRFGKSLTQDYLASFISTRQHKNANQVHKLSAKIQQLTRSVLFDLEDLFADDKPAGLFEISAFPDQCNYPEKFLQSKRTFYPKEIGIDNAVNVLIKSLKEADIRILTDSQVTNINLKGNSIQNLEITDEVGKKHSMATENVVWTVPLMGLCRHIFPAKKLPIFDQPKKTIIVNIVTSEPPVSNGLSWMFSHGHKFIHRISFPNNYSDPYINKFYKICVECVFQQNDLIEDLQTKVIKFLCDVGLVADPSKTLFIDTLETPGGFPNLSTINIQAIQETRDKIAERDIKNLFDVGILCQDDMFFQFDLIKNSYDKLSRIN